MTRDLHRPLREAWIIEAVRTPIGRYGGALASVRPDDLAAAAIRAGKPIVAYVKNMAADGSYYWVLAVVTPIAEGFLSIRLKPSASS